MKPDSMLLSRMSEHILEARHDVATEDFCRLLQGGAAPLDLEREALHTASPFLNVPAHVMFKPDGDLRSVNYDHTILGIWRSVRMSTMMPRGYENLPFAQAMYYLPQGLDIWSQILCEFPGHYAREQEKCPSINLKGPREHFEECPPLVEGSVEERLEQFLHATMKGDKTVAFRVFLGLADDAARDDALRTALEAQVLFAGIVDLPGPRLLTGQLVNPAHKAIRARAMVDLASSLGWERAYPAFVVVIPDLANEPRNHDLFEASTQLLRAAFGRDYRELRTRNTGAIGELEAEEFIQVMLDGTPAELMAHVTELLRRGISLVALNDVAIVASARLVARIENPSYNSGFSHATHCFDYTNIVGFWLRGYDHAHQVKAPYFAAHHVNDTAQFLRYHSPRDSDAEFTTQPEEYARHAEKLSLKETLVELAAVCRNQDAPVATALVESYLRRTHDRRELATALAFEAARFEGDPHIARNAMSHHEEYLHSTLPLSLRDDIFRSWVRFLSRAKKRSYEFNCVEIFEDVLLR